VNDFVHFVDFRYLRDRILSCFHAVVAPGIAGCSVFLILHNQTFLIGIIEYLAWYYLGLVLHCPRVVQVLLYARTGVEDLEEDDLALIEVIIINADKLF